MVTRNDIIEHAIKDCMKELYSYAVPHVEWENFIKENKEYKDGPKPYEFYYLPKEIMRNICDSYIYAYRFDEHQELLNTIEILKNYCKEPIIEKYIEGENGDPGYRGYEHPDNLEQELYFLLIGTAICDHEECLKHAELVQNKFFAFLDMAGKFYKWNGELNSFNASVYLGASPNSNKEAVIENWKKYRNKDIEINEEQIKKEYYGDDELD